MSKVDNIKENLDEVLDMNEIIALEKFNADPIMVGAVKKVILMGLYHNGTIQKGADPEPMRNVAFSRLARDYDRNLSNEQIGEDLRGLFEGISLLEIAFNSISVYKKEEDEQKVKKNPAL